MRTWSVFVTEDVVSHRVSTPYDGGGESEETASSRASKNDEVEEAVVELGVRRQAESAAVERDVGRGEECGRFAMATDSKTDLRMLSPDDGA